MITIVQYNPEVEIFPVIVLNDRRRIVSTGLLDQILVSAREGFRPAIVAGAHAIVIGHNQPSGDSTPSDADIRATRELLRAGQLLKIEVVDHIIVGSPSHPSLRSLGYFGIGMIPGAEHQRQLESKFPNQ